MKTREAPWSAAAELPPSTRYAICQGGSSAAALQGAFGAPIFMATTARLLELDPGSRRARENLGRRTSQSEVPRCFERVPLVSGGTGQGWPEAASPVDHPCPLLSKGGNRDILMPSGEPEDYELSARNDVAGNVSPFSPGRVGGPQPVFTPGAAGQVRRFRGREGGHKGRPYCSPET